MSEKEATVPDLDRAIHEPARLGIVALLYVVDSADFTFVRQRTDLTAGNLSAHLTKLEAAGYVEIEKSFQDRRPLTTLRLTAAGRASFRAYAQEMRRHLDRTLGAGGNGSSRKGRKP